MPSIRPIASMLLILDCNGGARAISGTPRSPCTAASMDAGRVLGAGSRSEGRLANSAIVGLACHTLQLRRHRAGLQRRAAAGKGLVDDASHQLAPPEHELTRDSM